MESKKIIISDVYKPRYSEVRQIIDMSNPKIRVNVWVEKMWNFEGKLFSAFERIFKENPIFNEPQLLMLEKNKLTSDVVDRILSSTSNNKMRHLTVIAIGQGLVFMAKSETDSFLEQLKRLILNCKNSNGRRGLLICGLAGFENFPGPQPHDHESINYSIRYSISRRGDNTAFVRMCDIRKAGTYIAEENPTAVVQNDGSLLQKSLSDVFFLVPQGAPVLVNLIFESIKSLAFDLYVTPVVQKRPTAQVVTTAYPTKDMLDKESCFPAVGLGEVHQALHQECRDYVGSSESGLQNLTENQRLNHLALPSLGRLASTAKYLPDGTLDEDELWD